MQVVTKEQIIEELKSIGLKENDVVMVHTSLKSMGYVCCGAQTVIRLMNQLELVDFSVQWMEKNRK